MLEAEKKSKTADGKLLESVSRLVSIQHWRKMSGVTIFRSRLRETFPCYTNMLADLWADKQRGKAPSDLPEGLWTRGGLIVKSVVTSAAGGVYSLHAYLRGMSTGHWQGLPRTNIQSCLADCIGDPIVTSLFWLCWKSRSNRLLLRHAVSAIRVSINKDRRDKVEAADRFTIVSDSIGSEIKDEPLRVNNGDVLSATVISILPKIQVRMFLECATETAVLNHPPCALEVGDTLAVQVSNTSGGRDDLQVCVSKSLLLREDCDLTKPVLVLTIEGVLGFMDSEGDGATGLFVPRPHVKEFLQFVLYVVIFALAF